MTLGRDRVLAPACYAEIVEAALESKGLRMTIVGMVIFLLSTLALVISSNGIPLIGMLLGGALVWGGFIWTLVQWYAANQPES